MESSVGAKEFNWSILAQETPTEKFQFVDTVTARQTLKKG
jgi:hypothetical protein